MLVLRQGGICEGGSPLWNISTYTRMHVTTHPHTRTRTQVRLCVSTCTHIYTSTHKHTQTHTSSNCRPCIIGEPTPMHVAHTTSASFSTARAMVALLTAPTCADSCHTALPVEGGHTTGQSNRSEDRVLAAMPGSKKTNTASAVS